MRDRTLTPEALARELDVSRETLDRLATYVELLHRWQRAVNLVGSSTLDDPWRRHVLDSAQLFAYLPTPTRTLVDLGSGAGFPGMVLAILGVAGVHLIEADRRKASFLAEVARVTATDVMVHAVRIEAMRSFAADVITARGLAPLPRLLELAEPFVTASSVCLFLKGGSVASELTRTARSWHMNAKTWPSRSDARGVVLQLKEIRRAPRR